MGMIMNDGGEECRGSFVPTTLTSVTNEATTTKEEEDGFAYLAHLLGISSRGAGLSWILLRGFGGGLTGIIKLRFFWGVET